MHTIAANQGSEVGGDCLETNRIFEVQSVGDRKLSKGWPHHFPHPATYRPDLNFGEDLPHKDPGFLSERRLFQRGTANLRGDLKMALTVLSGNALSILWPFAGKLAPSLLCQALRAS